MTPEQYEIARNGLSDPSFSPIEKEQMYATGKARLLRMRAEGTLNE